MVVCCDKDWTLDALGNWAALVRKAAGTTTLDQTRLHNLANELDGNVGTPITATVGGNWADCEYDDAGNMTLLPRPLAPNFFYVAKYDAWNRLVEVKTSSTVVQQCEYDGQNRRIVKLAYSGGSLVETRHYYYNDQWQVVEERVGADGDSARVDAQYVWHPHYVDALAMRRRDADESSGNGLEEVHYYLQDANYNVTALVDAGGDAVERYHYTPYGEVTFLNAADFSVKGTQVSAVKNVNLYTGRERDPETGLQLNRQRYYAAHLGRWVNRDPIGYEGSQWNLYEYGTSRPLITVDPEGLQFGMLICPPGTHPGSCFGPCCVPDEPPRQDSGFKLCQRTISGREGNKFDAACSIEHQYIQFDEPVYQDNGSPDLEHSWGWGFGPGGAQREKAFRPTACCNYSLATTGTLAGSNKPCSTASAEDIKNCLECQEPKGPYRKITYDCTDYAKDAAKACCLEGCEDFRPWFEKFPFPQSPPSFPPIYIHPGS